MDKIMTLQEWRESLLAYEFNSNWNLLQSSFRFNERQYNEDVAEEYARYVLYHPANELSEPDVVAYVKEQIKNKGTK